MRLCVAVYALDYNGYASLLVITGAPQVYIETYINEYGDF